MSITVLCPSRGNPRALFEAAYSFLGTKMEGGSTFVPVIDSTDPELETYFAFNEEHHLPIEIVPIESTGTMNSALNWAARRYAEKADIVGFIGDDHRFKTRGWDRVVAKVLADNGGGILYGDDLAMREELPTQVFISSAIIRALGWMGLPPARHLYLDNAWKLLGEEADCLYFLPDIVIEHLHPAYGKAEWDANHLRVNTDEMYSHDRAVFEAWVNSGRAAQDVERVRSALARP